MRVETGRGGETLVAHLADVRLLPRVRPHMPLQQAWPVEGLAADLTGQHRLLPGTPPRGGRGQEWAGWGETPGKVLAGEG